MENNQDQSGTDIFQLVGILWRGKFVIAFFCALFAIIGVYYAFMVAEARFSATARIALDVRQAPVVDLESVVSGVSTETSALNTELEFVRSLEIIEKVVEDLNLVEEPYLNRTLQEDEKFSIDNVRRALRELILGPAQEAPVPTKADIQQSVVNNTRAAIAVTMQRNTYIFNIRATTDSAVLSKKIVNAVADAYLRNQIEQKFSATEYAVSLLSKRVTDLEQELQAQEEELQEFRSTTDLSDVEALGLLNSRIKNSRNRLADIEAELVIAKVASEEGKAIAASGDQDLILEHFQDRTLAEIAERENVRLFASRVETLLQTLDANLQRGESRKNALLFALTELEEQRAEQSQDLLKINEMTRNIQATSVLYETFLARLKETSAQLGLQSADAQVLSLAQRGFQIAPRRSRLVTLGIVLGFAVGAGLVLLRQFRRKGFRQISETEQETGLPVIGQVPKLPIRKRGGLLPYLKENPTSAAAEAIRNLRTSILMSRIDNPPQIIMGTSALPGEGKTTMSMALAQNLSGLGKRVLLVEGDIRRRAFSDYVRSDGQIGLASVIIGEDALEDAVFYDENIGVDVLLGQKTNANAADLFSSQKFEQLLAHMRSLYDYIVIDTPPVLVVPDARIIGRHCDVIIFAVRWDFTHKEQVTDGLRELSSVGLSPSGLVLTQIDATRMKNYGYGAYAAYGKSYYGA